jgi:hypothetical protein
MARAVCFSAPLSGAAPLLRTCRLGCGLVCHVSAVSRGRSPGHCSPQLRPQLFVITGEAVTSRSRSSSILMGWWSEQCNDFIKVLIAAGRARQNPLILGEAAQAWTMIPLFVLPFALAKVAIKSWKSCDDIFGHNYFWRTSRGHYQVSSVSTGSS